MTGAATVGAEAVEFALRAAPEPARPAPSQISSREVNPGRIMRLGVARQSWLLASLLFPVLSERPWCGRCSLCVFLTSGGGGVWLAHHVLTLFPRIYSTTFGLA